MPTRTERLAKPTFLEKLSRHNPYKKLKAGAYYDDVFTNGPPGERVVAYSPQMQRSEKQEWLAATSWMASHGYKIEAYELLSDDALQTLVNMFSLGEAELDRARAIDRVLKVGQLIHEARAPGAVTPELSADSSGTDAPPRRRGGRARSASAKSKAASGHRRSKTSTATRHTSTAAPETTGETAGEAPRPDGEVEAGGHADSESESWSSSSGGSSPDRVEGGRRHQARRDRADEASEAEPQNEDSPQRRTGRKSRKERARSLRSKSESSASDMSRDRSPRRGARSRAHRREHDVAARRRGRSSSASDDSQTGYDDESSSDDERCAGRSRSRKRRQPRKRSSRKSVYSGSERSRSSSSSPVPAGGVDTSRRRASSGHTSRTATSRSSSGQGQFRERHASSSSGERASSVQFATGRHRRRHRSPSSDSASPDVERKKSKVGTDFLRINKAEAPSLCKECGCSLCRMYVKVRRASSDEILRAARPAFTRFERPDKRTDRSGLQEWAAMVFWCMHPISTSSWNDLPRRERRYIIKSVLAPNDWSSSQVSAFAETTVRQLREDTSALIRCKVTHHANSGAGGAGEEARSTPTRAGTKAAFLAKIKSLEFNPMDWLDASETKDIIQVRKLVSLYGSGGAAGTSMAGVPYASTPWTQNLAWAPSKPMNFVQAGRMLSVALRTHSDLFTDQVEQLARRSRVLEDERLFGEFDTACNDSDIGRVLLCVDAAKQYAADILAGAWTDAQAWHEKFRMPESKAILEGRTRQKTELEHLFVALRKSVSIGSGAQTTTALKDTYTRGAWMGFFEGLRAGRHSAELIKITMKRGKRSSRATTTLASSTDKSGSSRSDSDSAEEDRRSKRKKQKREASRRKVDGVGKRDGHTKPVGALCKFQVHFPCSISILGPGLGVECSATGPCRHCGKTRHWSGECPVHWASTGAGLPGYKSNGKRIAGKWDGDRNPKKDIAREWVRFIQHFKGGGSQALEPNAPNLAAFKTWVGKAAP